MIRTAGPAHLIRALALALCSTPGVAAPMLLPAPTEAQSLESVETRLSSLTLQGDQLLLLPQDAAKVVTVPFHPPTASPAKSSPPSSSHAPMREATFGPLLAQQRWPVGTPEMEQDFVAARLGEGRALLFDGTSASVVELALPGFKEILRRSMAWDLLRPPADRGGEATQAETAALRAKFKVQWLKTLGRKLAGVVALPASWQRGAKPTYLAVSRVEGFPLLEIACEGEEAPSACVLTRQCYLEGASDLASAAISGIAVSAARRLVLIGDSARQRLLSFKFDSCFHVYRQAEYQLPPKLKSLSGVFVDEGDRLWVTTAARDDYLNASLYFWRPSEW